MNIDVIIFVICVESNFTKPSTYIKVFKTSLYYLNVDFFEEVYEGIYVVFIRKNNKINLYWDCGVYFKNS